MEYKDYYKILGVSRTADADEIKRAYRKPARGFPPDKNKAKGAGEKFQDINKTKEVMSDPKKPRVPLAPGSPRTGPAALEAG